MTKLFAIATALVASACMTGPYDHQRVTRQSDPIEFHGYHLQPNSSVTIQARNWDTGEFETIEVVRSDDSALSEFDSHPLYPWSHSEVLPARFWEPGNRGARTEVRSLWSTTNEDRDRLTAEEGAMVAVDRGWFNCSREYDTVASFREHCAANDANVVRIRTRNYCQNGPAPRISSVQIREDRGVRYDFSISVGRTGDTVSRVFVNGSWLNCNQVRSSPREFKCGTTYNDPSSQFSGGCEIESWLEGGGQVFVDATDSSSTCFGSATLSRRAETRDGILCSPRPTRPDSPPARTDEICRSEPVPSGWIITNDFHDSNRCGRPTAIDDYNVLEIVEYAAMPRGATLDVCTRSRVPSGWGEIRTFLDPNRCGHPSLGATPNVRTIFRR